jgi:succinate dehydrogenase/fumarate reductase-like Fe-S protein
MSEYYQTLSKGDNILSPIEHETPEAAIQEHDDVMRFDDMCLGGSGCGCVIVLCNEFDEDEEFD